MHDIQPSGAEELNIHVREFGPFSPEDCLIDNSIIQATFVCAECIIYLSTVSEGVLVILRIYLALSKATLKIILQKLTVLMRMKKKQQIALQEVLEGNSC